MSWWKTAREMILLAGLRAALAALALIGRELRLGEAERRAVLARAEAAILGPTLS